MTWLKFCQSVTDFTSLKHLNISGNYLPFFCVDALANSLNLPLTLDLSDTRLDDLSAFHFL